MNLADLNKKRQEFLLAAYELAEGEAKRDILTQKLTEVLGVDYEEIRKIARYWLEEGKVFWNSFERIHLTPEGRSEAEKIIEANVQRLKCPNCRQDIGRDAKFCEHCGKPVDKPDATTLPMSGGAVTTLRTGLPRVSSLLASKYEILGELGQGAGGAVYIAHRILIGDQVAIKVLHDKHLAETQFRERFLREAIAAAKIHHPNIVKIYDFDQGNGTDAPAFLVMELVEGESLDKLLRRKVRLTPIRAVTLAREICAGVGAAHRVNVFHRDLKPSNIIILPPLSESTTESVKIIDFGIAKFTDIPAGHAVTELGTVMGTPLYMSPEQCRGEPCDARSDVYSLGVILYELIVGKPPFNATNNADIMSMHLHSEPPEIPSGAGVAPELQAVIMRALAKEPNTRQIDATVLSLELKTALMDQPRIQGRDLLEREPKREPLPIDEFSDSSLAEDELLEEADNLVFKSSCEKALKVGHLKHVSVMTLVKDLSLLGLNQDQVLDALEILTGLGYIEPSRTVGCGMRICDFEITPIGFEEYATRHINDFEGKRQSVILDIVSNNKQVFERADLITAHILEMLHLEGSIKIAKFIGGNIEVRHVSAQLRRQYKNYQATTLPN